MLKLSSGQVNSWRLSKHHLIHRANRRAIAEVLTDVCGIQAQVLSAAELAIRARVEGTTKQDVREALWKDHSIVKTWCMRGTLHLLSSSDLPTYVAALKTKLPATLEWLRRDLGVQPSEVEAISGEIKTILEDKTLTRDDLALEIERRAKLSKVSRRHFRSAWGTLFTPAAYQGILAFGPSVGARATFLRPDRWMAEWKEPSSKEAFSELFRRFLRAYGPVMPSDFAHWWGNLRGEEESLLEANRCDLEEVQIEGHRGWMLGSDAEEVAGLEPTHAVRLLPSFDCYAMFYSPRESFVPKAHRSRVFRQTAGWNYPTLIVDGFAVGIWRLRKRSKGVEVDLEAFRELASAEERRVQEEASDIGRFYELPAEVRYVEQLT